MTETKPYFAVDEPDKIVVALGNEAIARGAMEAGCILGSGYPGTPSTEILETLTEMAQANPQLNIKTEWSINEKVGFEVAYAGALCNVRSIVTMKHVGFNVISDSFFNAALAGTIGGFIVISADDPSLHSSQNEQDNRFFGMQALVPVFEPSDVQEAKDLIKYAFEFSERFQSLVIYRTTTRLNHSRGDLKLGPIDKLDREYGFGITQSERMVNTPESARKNRLSHLDRFNSISQFAEEFPFNFIQEQEGAQVGIISSGIPYAHIQDAINILQIQDQVALFKLGMTFPLPRQKLAEFLRKYPKIYVVEELEPILEQTIKSIAFEDQISVEIHGKDIFPQIFELYPELIVEKLSSIFDIKNPLISIDKCGLVEPPPRPPVLCPGCGHRNIYTAVKRVERRLKVRLVHSSDIGCYTLGFYEPLNAIDNCIAMGASIGMANGISVFDSRVSMAFLGDSTFFHSGLAALMNAVKNHREIIVFILDNLSTSMTGHQDHPGTGVKIDKSTGQQISIEKLVQSIGVLSENIWVTDADNLQETETAVEAAINATGVRVVIPRVLCALLKVERSKKQKIPLTTYCIDPDLCSKDEICMRLLGCPAINKENGNIIIDDTACSGCGVCVQICPKNAIHLKE